VEPSGTYKFRAVGVWDEWCASFAIDRWGWLAVAQIPAKATWRCSQKRFIMESGRRKKFCKPAAGIRVRYCDVAWACAL